MKPFILPAAILGFTVFMSVPAAPVLAWNLKATPSLTVEESWDTNILNVSTGETEDFVTRATPRLTMTLEAFRTAVSVSGGFEAEWFAEHSELNKSGATRIVDLTAAEPLRFTPRFSLRPSARFAETRDAARRNVLTASADPALPPAETSITERTGLREYSGSVQMTYLLTPNVDLGLGGGGTKRDYFEGAPGLVDSRTLSGNASAGWRVSPLLSTGVFFDTSRNSFDDRPASRTYSGGLSGGYVLTEHYRADVRAGASYLVESTVAGGPTSRDWSPYGRLSVTYAAQSFRASFAGSYELAGTGSFGRTTKRGNATLSLSHQFARDWGWDLAVTGQSNRSTEDPVTEDLLTASGSAGVRYAAARWASLRLAGTVNRQWADGLVGNDLERYTVFLALTLSDTYLLL